MRRTLVASQASAANELEAPLAQPLRIAASAVALPHPEKVRLGAAMGALGRTGCRRLRVH